MIVWLGKSDNFELSLVITARIVTEIRETEPFQVQVTGKVDWKIIRNFS